MSFKKTTNKLSIYDKKEVITAYTFLLPLLIGVVIFFIIPIAQAFFYSLTKWKGIGEATFVGLKNYVNIFTVDTNFLLELKNSIVYVVGTVPVTIAIALMFASLINSKIRGISFYRVIYFLPNVVMMAVVAMVWRWLLNSQYGIVDAILGATLNIRPAWLSDTNLTMISMCGISVWQGMGYCIVILLSGLQGVSKSYYEAAKMEGANGIQQFFGITLPLVTPTLFFLFITRVIFTFNQFDLVYMLAKDRGPIQQSLRTLVFGIYQSGFEDFARGYACAKAVMLFMVIMVVTFLQFQGEKRWVNY